MVFNCDLFIRLISNLCKLITELAIVLSKKKGGEENGMIDSAMNTIEG